ncbi:MAG: hypothetical protein ACPLRX_09425 [Candidatus Saccharicenans sp.]
MNHGDDPWGHLSGVHGFLLRAAVPAMLLLKQKEGEKDDDWSWQENWHQTGDTHQYRS